MLHSSANRATSVSVDNITKLVRQNYQPITEQEYSHEKVLCRTETNCQKGKPDDYWTTNFRRRQSNLQKGFYTSSTEPYRPIGGQLILDSYELILSNITGSASGKLSPRMTRSGTMHEEQKTKAGESAQEKSEDEKLSDSSLGLEDTAPSAGFDDIRKLLKESQQRIVSVRAGNTYEDHVKAVEEANNLEKQANKPEDSGMVLKSVSSIFMPAQTNKSQPDSHLESGRTSKQSSNMMAASDKLTLSDVIKTPTTNRRGSGGRAMLRPPSVKNKLTLLQVGGGITTVMLRKERQFRDHLLFLGSIYNILTALHNLRVKDIRSKVPLSKEVVERLQKENCREDDIRGSRGVHVRSRNAACISSDRQALETWEDLLNVQPEPYKEKSSFGGGVAGIFFQVGLLAKFMRWHRKPTLIPSEAPGTVDKKQLSHLQEIHEKGSQAGTQVENEAPSQHRPGSATQTTDRVKKLPIWQQVAHEKSTVFQDLKQTTPNPEGTVQRLRKNLIKLKRSIQKENNATLEKIVRERVANFRLKFSTLNSEECSPLFEEQKLKLQVVKDSVNKTHLENFDVQPSKWFEELKEKTVTLISSYHQPQIIDMLTKVQNYAHMDNKTVSYPKAKLCLLMMSLPAYDICQIYTQKALKFIFENILLGQEAQFYEWLHHRKIPNMVISESVSRSSTVSPAPPFRDVPSPYRDSVSPPKG